jgi:hypothetical protein
MTTVPPIPNPDAPPPFPEPTPFPDEPDPIEPVAPPIPDYSTR